MNDEPTFDPQRRREIRSLLIDTVNATPDRHHARRIKLTVALIVVAGVTATGTAAVALNGGSLFGLAATITSAPSTPTPTPASALPTVAPTSAAPTPITAAAPSVTLANDAFTAPSWGDGLTARMAGLTPNHEYSISVDARYRGEAKEPQASFSMLTTPLAFTTNGSGAATVTWAPDNFPQNFTEGGESGFMLASYVRVDDGSSGPAHADTPTNLTEPAALSVPLSIRFLPIDSVTVTAPSCVEPEQLVSGEAGLPVTLTGMAPRELIFVSSYLTANEQSFTFIGDGTSDDSGNATVVMHSNSAEYPVSTSESVAPSTWHVVWSGGFRVTPTDANPVGSIPITIGDCGAG